MEKGDRIGAILGTDFDTDTVLVLGYGVFQGHAVPPPEGGWVAKALHESGQTNPKLLLDTGEVVWGCQCWFGTEETIKDKIQKFAENGWAIKTVSMAESLKEAP